MPRLIDETPEASAWVERLFAEDLDGPHSRKLSSGVIWIDSYLNEGEALGGNDPSKIINEINERGWPLLRGHDPGLPVGRAVSAQEFRSPSGVRFVAAIFVYYEQDQQLRFANLGIDPLPSVSSPATLESLESLLDGNMPAIATDPREVDSLWLDDVLKDSPLPVQRVVLSHNAAESVKELIRIGLPTTFLIWNPFVTTIANEAAKDVYAGIRGWLQKLWKKLKELRDPIVVVQTIYNGCDVSFLFRGRDIEQHYNAHDALPIAAVQAFTLIDRLRDQNANPVSLTYEFEHSRWFPSYAILADGRIVSDRNLLIAIEQLPKSLSMGISI